VSNDSETFHLLYVHGMNHAGAVPISITGPSDRSAQVSIGDALEAVGLPRTGGAGFALSMREDGLAGDGLDNQFLNLTGDEALADLRLLVGPDDSAVVLRSTGFGGPDLGEVMGWTLQDLLPHLRAALEIYGAVQVARDVGRAVEARKNRRSRQDADYWVRSGRGEVPSYLLSAVQARGLWSIREMDRAFALPAADGARLMTACGYAYNSVNGSYYLPGWPAL
jgi:hypothetical protein